MEKKNKVTEVDKTTEHKEDSIKNLAEKKIPKKTSCKKAEEQSPIVVESIEAVVKKNPADVEIVEPEDINDFYNFIDFNWEGTSYNTTIPRKHASKKKYEMPNPKHIKAFIPGAIQKVYVSDGSKVKHNEKLLVLEAMKMKNNLLAPFAGEIKKVLVKQGQQVSKNELLIEFK